MSDDGAGTEVVRQGPSLLEREGELAELESLLDDVEARRSRVLLVEGPAGIGKTALLGALGARADERGLAVLPARGGELEQGFGFGVVRQLLEPRLANADEERRHRLFAGAAELAAPVLASAPETSAQEDAPQAALHGLYWLLVNLAEERPLLLVVDDVHWADSPSVRFLIYLAHRLEGLPIALALGSRTGEAAGDDELQRTLRAEARPPILRPSPLGEAATQEMVRAVLGEHVDRTVGDECHEVSAGNPFLLVELLEELRFELRASGVLRTDLVRKLGPERIASSLLLRLGRVDPHASALALAVAVLGTHAGVDDAATLASLEPAAARMLAGRLAAVAVLEPGEPLRFVHPIVRTAIYDDAAPEERARLHAAAVALLRARHAEPQTIAVHLLASAPAADPQVVDSLRAAAAEAVGRGAPESAVRYLRRALAEPPDSDRRAEVALELGLAQELAGQIPEAERFLRESYEASGSSEQRARAALELGRVLMLSERGLAEAVAVLTRGLEELGETDSVLRWQLKVLQLVMAQATEQTQRLLPEVVARADAEFDRLPPPGRQILAAPLAEERAISGDSAEAVIELAREALGEGRLLAEAGVQPPFHVACVALMDAGRPDEAEREETAAIGVARRQGSPVGLATACAVRSVARWRQGSLAGAESDARLTLELTGSEGWQIPHYFAVSTLLFVLVTRGRVEEAAALLDAHAAVMPGESDLRQHVRAAEAALMLARGDPRGALGALRQIGAWATGRNPPGKGLAPIAWRSMAAAALARLGEHEEARALAGEEARLARRFGDPAKVGVALRVLGQVEADARGIELLTEAVATLAPSTARLEHARALVELGSALRRAGKRSDARNRLEEGMDLAHHCRADALVDRARDELVRLGSRPRRNAVTGVDALTPSERRVAEMAAEGMTNKEIAQSLFVTLRTVEGHLSETYRKLGIESRRGLPAAFGP